MDGRTLAEFSNATVDRIDLEWLARRVGTPCHVYSASAIRQRIHHRPARDKGRKTLTFELR